MRYVVFAIPDEFADRVMLVPTDPRDGPVAACRVAGGTESEAVIGLLSRCTTQELHDLRHYVLPGIQRKVAAEERARKQLDRETSAVPVSEIQRSLGSAVAEEEFRSGIWG